MSEHRGRLGYMQGRLSPPVNGKIQAFPWTKWREEFAVAASLGLTLMEWTLDHDRLFHNPLLTSHGRREIALLSSANGVHVGALTGDVFMQAPFWKAEGVQREALLREFDAVLDACADAGIGVVVVPLVDNGRLENVAQEAVLLQVLLERAGSLRANTLRIAFESDYAAARLATFIGSYPHDVFGINYDSGNSAALGFSCDEEIGTYLDRIFHVHIKDRVRGGTTVPLGTGDADLPRVVRLLESGGYRGNYVLQTARAADGEHAAALARYRDMTLSWLAGAA
jgi:L-ribulose-5-phosphate 3-epimerase